MDDHKDLVDRIFAEEEAEKAETYQPPAPTASIVRASVDGDTLDCVKNERGVWVSVARVCEVFGIDHRSQLSKLKGKAWACVVLITTQDASGRAQEMSMLHLDSLALWLATIDTGRVAESVRMKLERYQVQAAKVLRDFFFPTEPAAPALEGLEAYRRAEGVVDVAQASGLLDARGACLRKAALLRTLAGIDVLADPGVAFAPIGEIKAAVAQGQAVLVLPVQSLEGTYSATTLGKAHGLSAMAVNKLSRLHKIFGEEPYGRWDDILHGDGSLLKPHWRYNDCGKAALTPILEAEAARRASTPPKRKRKAKPNALDLSPSDGGLVPCGAKNVNECVCERCGGPAPQGDAYCHPCRGGRPSPPARTASVEEVMDWMEVTDENPFA